MRYLFLFVVLLTIGCRQEDSPSSGQTFIQPPSSIRTKENIDARYAYEMAMVTSPSTGKLPANIHYLEMQYARNLSAQQSSSRTLQSDENWSLIGPFNVGGRTRALALDLDNEAIILAGGVSGGVWKSENGGSSWKRTSHPSALNSVTCIAQDPSDGNRSVWYHGTGELRGNSARETGAPYRGDGIYKSIDGGDSWDVIPSTETNMEGVFDSPFNYTWNMIAKESGVGPGQLYIAIYGGIVRSLDGGQTWETVLGMDLLDSTLDDLNESGAPFFTNVLLTPGGRFYATLSTTTGLGDDFSASGIYTSTTGNPGEWSKITPGTFPPSYDRVVMAYAPSDESIVYFYVSINDANYLFRYRQSNDNWKERSENLPSGDGIEVLDSQSSYNMVIKVHPQNANTVFIGGTNLYRSTDGFSSPNNTTHIGGYKTDGSFEPYDHHHPDQHEIVFLPSNPDKMLTANDGGIQLTNNNLASVVSWESKNNGYITSQFYSVALSKEESDGQVVGGMQDNGTYFRSDNSSQSSDWTRLIGGDGGFCASTPGNSNWYISFQESNVFRVVLGDENNIVQFAQVDPEGGGGYLFINPFVMDPNNYNRMYLAGGNVLWRNDNLLLVPSGDQNPTNVNWTAIDETALSQQITALDVSGRPSDIVYFGNGSSEVYRLDSADSNSPVLTQLPTLDSGYVSSISIDPSNADRIMFTYSNYNIQSVFLSQDGGETTVPIGGNLEENNDGSGSGPSIRCSKIVPLQDGSVIYYVGTSTGLYKTTEPDGHGTVWQKIAENEIGNALIRQIDYRQSDGRIVVATHGNGIFESIVENTLMIDPTFSDRRSVQIENIYPNPFTDKVNILLTIPKQDFITIDIYDRSGRRVKRLTRIRQFAGEVKIQWDGTTESGDLVPPGLYLLRVSYQGNIQTGKILFSKG